eukprot:TRINITY_DN16613_c0_g1_i1.p1 TRINITY_DN16613_c0_g1~~TRINITY_DN16613_c0_g1_i1.p1  ORF type:complete len:619 (+),score=121.66 TRINITY_DN16613_c0_g1_i1:19-1875(+)
MPAQQDGQAGGSPQSQQQGTGRSFFWTVLRTLVILYLVQSFMGGHKKAPVDSVTGVPLAPHRNLFKYGQPMTLRVYMAPSETFSDFGNKEALLWKEEGLTFDSTARNTRAKNTTFVATAYLQQNGTMFAHIYFTKYGHSPDPRNPHYDPLATSYRAHSMVRFLPKPRAVNRTNLISGETKEEISTPRSAKSSDEIISYWKPELTLNLVEDWTAYPRGKIPPQLLKHFTFEPTGGDTQDFYPTIVCNEFWSFREHLIPLNETVTELTLAMSYSTISLLKWQMMAQMEESWKMQESWGSSTEAEAEDFKRMLVETNPWLLGITLVVSLLHTVFDFLAFKNDIQFWRNNKSMEGLSMRSILMNTAMQVVIFLYLLDNETSWLILISTGIGCLIEFWKVTKAADVSLDRSRWIPIVIRDKASYTKETKRHDDAAMRYLSYVLLPLVIGYSIYSLIYETHRNWYSWVLNSLVGCVYTFGFIMMTPQLFINYKLKTVAQLPWRVFVYRALNTFIDDLFAFIIKMPTLHRLSCFRDDIVFIIYLYQRWIYPVDKKRRTEGPTGEVEEEEPLTQEPATDVIEPPPAEAEEGPAFEAQILRHRNVASTSPNPSTPDDLSDIPDKKND